MRQDDDDDDDDALKVMSARALMYTVVTYIP